MVISLMLFNVKLNITSVGTVCSAKNWVN